MDACRRGHKWTPENTYRDKNGWRTCKRCRADGASRRLRADPEARAKSKVYARAAQLRKYGLTIEQYDAMHEAQGGVCAICLKPERLDKRLAVDHDHETGRVRGLLCYQCNHVLLGGFGSAELLLRASRYLR